MNPTSSQPPAFEADDFGALVEQVTRDLHFGRLVPAAETVQQMLEMAPDSTTAHELYGDVLQAQGQPEAAREAYQKALELEPANADAERKFAELSLQAKQAEWDREAMLRGDLEKFRGAPHKEPGPAAVRSALFPGLGQLYNGDFELGIALVIVGFALWAAVLLLFAIPLIELMVAGLGGNMIADGPSVWGWLSLVALFIVYGYSIWEAYRAASAKKT